MEVTFWLGWLFAVLGLGVILQQKLLKRKARASQAWPSTEGEIVKSQVVRNRGQSGGTTFKADVEYRYNVKARRYKGKNVCLSIDVATGDRGRAENRCALYPDGRIVQVYYNPMNPADACLERRVDAPYFYTIIAASFMFFGCGMIFGLINF